MKQKVSLRHLTFLAICVALSLVTKRVISPVTNLLTDFLRIPGGGAATAFSVAILERTLRASDASVPAFVVSASVVSTATVVSGAIVSATGVVSDAVV